MGGLAARCFCSQQAVLGASVFEAFRVQVLALGVELWVFLVLRQADLGFRV